MEDSARKQMLTQYKRVHMIGISPKPERPSHKVAMYLVAHGYEVIGIRPGVDNIDGIPCFPDVESAPGPIEILDVFRASQYVPEIVEQAIKHNVKWLWLQEGVTHTDAEQKAKDAGITVTSDLCIKKEHTRLLQHQ